MQRRNFSLACRLGLLMRTVIGQEGAPILAEHVLVEEGVEVFGDRLFPEEEGAAGWVSFRDVVLLGCTDVVGGDLACLAIHAARAVIAEDVGPVSIGAFGLRMRILAGSTP